MNQPTQIRLDLEVGAGYVTYRSLGIGERVMRTERLSDDVFVDYDAASEILGIEVLAFDSAALSVAQTFALAHALEFPPRLDAMNVIG